MLSFEDHEEEEDTRSAISAQSDQETLKMSSSESTTISEDMRLVKERKYEEIRITRHAENTVTGRDAQSIDKQTATVISQLNIVNLAEGVGVKATDNEIGYQILIKAGEVLRKFGLLCYDTAINDLQPKDFLQRYQEQLTLATDSIEKRAVFQVRRSSTDLIDIHDKINKDRYDAQEKIEFLQSKLDYMEEHQLKVKNNEFQGKSDVEIDRIKTDDLETMKTKISLKYSKLYIQDFDENEIMREKLEKRHREIKKLNSLVSVFNTVQLVHSHMAQKISAAAKMSEEVYGKLTRTTTIKVSKRKVNNPVLEGDLTAILQILHDEFGSSTITIFVEGILRGFQSISSSNAINYSGVSITAAEKGTKTLHRLQRNGSLKYITPEYITVSIVLANLQNAPKSLVRDVYTFVSKLERDIEDKITERRNEYHILDELIEYLKRYDKTTIEMRQGKENVIAGKGAHQPMDFNNPESKYGYGGNTEDARLGIEYEEQSQDVGNEIAHSAVRSNIEEKPRVAGKNYTQHVYSNIYSREGATRFDKEVRKSENIGVTNVKGNTFPYVAVSELNDICKKCYPVGTAPVEPCKKRCFSVKCGRCDYVGHTSGVCLQGKKRDGTDLK